MVNLIAGLVLLLLGLLVEIRQIDMVLLATLGLVLIVLGAVELLLDVTGKRKQ